MKTSRAETRIYFVGPPRNRQIRSEKKEDAQETEKEVVYIIKSPERGWCLKIGSEKVERMRSPRGICAAPSEASGDLPSSLSLFDNLLSQFFEATTDSPKIGILPYFTLISTT